MFGMKFTLGISRYVKMILHPRGLIFLVLCAFLLFASDPNDLRTALGAPFALIAWTASVIFYLATLFVIICLFSFATDKFGPFLIYIPVTSSLGLLFVYVTVQAVIGYFTNGAYQNPIYPLFFNLMGAGLVIETLFVRFVMPSIFPEDHQQPGADLLVIGDRRFPIEKILHIMSQEHYLQVTLSNEVLTIRARLSDVIDQTSKDQGLQPHRSWWVATTAQPKMSKANGRAALSLADGTIVPIAKARVNDVQEWLDIHSDW